MEIIPCPTSYPTSPTRRTHSSRICRARPSRCITAPIATYVKKLNGLVDYRNQKQRYVDAFWQLVNWDFVAENLDRDRPYEVT